MYVKINVLHVYDFSKFIAFAFLCFCHESKFDHDKKLQR